MYAPVAGDWLPQVFVFDRAGTCVGVISKPDPQTVAALALAALDKRTKACDLTVSDEFPGESAGNRTAIVQMIGLGGEAEAFCQNCTTVRNALDKALQERKDVRLDVLAVDLSKTDSEP